MCRWASCRYTETGIQRVRWNCTGIKHLSAIQWRPSFKPAYRVSCRERRTTTLKKKKKKLIPFSFQSHGIILNLAQRWQQNRSFEKPTLKTLMESDWYSYCCRTDTISSFYLQNFLVMESLCVCYWGYVCVYVLTWHTADTGLGLRLIEVWSSSTSL